MKQNQLKDAFLIHLIEKFGNSEQIFEKIANDYSDIFKRNDQQPLRNIFYSIRDKYERILNNQSRFRLCTQMSNDQTLMNKFVIQKRQDSK